MKNIIFIIIAIVGVVIIYLYTNSKVDFETDTKEGIHFYKGTWQEALQTAKKENKLIFLDIYVTWCGPCKNLKKTTFADKEVGAFFNQQFINVALDGEKTQGDILMKKYGLDSYPSLLFINGDGKVIFQTGGYQSPEELLEITKQVKQLLLSSNSQTK